MIFSALQRLVFACIAIVLYSFHRNKRIIGVFWLQLRWLWPEPDAAGRWPAMAERCSEHAERCTEPLRESVYIDCFRLFCGGALYLPHKTGTNVNNI